MTPILHHSVILWDDCVSILEMGSMAKHIQHAAETISVRSTCRPCGVVTLCHHGDRPTGMPALTAQPHHIRNCGNQVCADFVN